MNGTGKVTAGGVVLVAAWCWAAAAQANMAIGLFQNAQTWFLGPGGAGIAEFSQTQVRLDDDGDGLVGADDPLYNLPTAIQFDTQDPPRWTIQRFLSPTQQALYTLKFGANGFSVGPHPDDVIVFFHRLDAPPTARDKVRAAAVLS